MKGQMLAMYCVAADKSGLAWVPPTQAGILPTGSPALQDSLGFRPSQMAASIVGESCRAQAATQAAWRQSRRRFLLGRSAQRTRHCQPLAGHDLARALFIPKAGQIHEPPQHLGLATSRPGVPPAASVCHLLLRKAEVQCGAACVKAGCKQGSAFCVGFAVRF